MAGAFAALATAAPPLTTYPPSPEDRPAAKEALATARVALFAGRTDQAYRLLLTAQPDLGQTPEFLELAARVYLALDRPLRMADCYLALSKKDASAAQKVRAVLTRQGGGAPRTFLAGPSSRWPGFDRERLKDVVAVAPGPSGTVFLLRGTGLEHVDSDGRSLGLTAFSGGLDLTVDFEGRPVALGEGKVLWGDRAVPLPASMDKPASAAVSPGGSLFILDRGSRRLLRLDSVGAVSGVTAVPLQDPVKVRVDPAGRIYIADRDTSRVEVFGPDMAPVKSVSPEAAQHAVRRIEDMSVDFAGDVMLLDGKAHQLLLFSPDGRFLGTSADRIPRVDAAGWDGLGVLVYVAEKEGTLGKAGT